MIRERDGKCVFCGKTSEQASLQNSHFWGRGDKVNRFNLAAILAMLGEKENALQEIEELLIMEPDNPTFKSLRKAVLEQIK
jgi:hypothetical protein